MTRLPWDDAAVAAHRLDRARRRSSLAIQNDQGDALPQQTFNVCWRITTAAFDPDVRRIDIDVHGARPTPAPACRPVSYVLSSNKNNGELSPCAKRAGFSLIELMVVDWPCSAW